MNDAPPQCRCLCGAVRFFLAEPLREVGMCHCGICRRWSGGVPLAGGMTGAVTVTADDALRWYASSAWGERGFCARCGSSLFWRQKGARGGWLVSVGALPSVDNLRLVQHIYIDDKPAFYDFTGGARRLTGDAFTDEVSAAMPAFKRMFVKTFIVIARLHARVRPPPPPSPGADRRGRCVCGTVRFRLPRAPREAYLCHCGQCRRWGGGVGVVGVTTGVDAVDGDVRWHASSARCERGFCATCGASLFRRSRTGGDIREVCAGALEDDRGLQLTEHICIEDKPAFYGIKGDAARVSGADCARRKQASSN